MKLIYKLMVITATCLVLAAGGAAFAEEQMYNEHGQIRLADIPKVSRPPKFEDFINGTPREAELAISDFIQSDPGDGVPVSQPTTAFLSYGKTFKSYYCC